MNSIFRAAHTIKGSSAGVGLKSISDFTHHLEGVLDLMREGRLEPEKDIIDTLLNAVDVIKEMLEDQASGKPHREERIDSVKKKIESIREREKVITEKDFRIIFSPSADLFKRGIDPVTILEDLGRLGKIMSIKAVALVLDVPGIIKASKERREYATV